MLVAKAVVIAAVAFVVGAAAAAVSIPLGNHILRTNGNYVYPASTLTELRVILGTGALVALAAVLALALGTALRRGAGAVTAAIVLIVLPYMLAFASALPAGVSQWLMRITPAAAFAVAADPAAIPPGPYLYTPSRGLLPAGAGRRPGRAVRVHARRAAGRGGSTAPETHEPRAARRVDQAADRRRHRMAAARRDRADRRAQRGRRRWRSTTPRRAPARTSPSSASPASTSARRSSRSSPC